MATSLAFSKHFDALSSAVNLTNAVPVKQEPSGELDQTENPSGNMSTKFQLNS
jgi:hypothetical protein